MDGDLLGVLLELLPLGSARFGVDRPSSGDPWGLAHPFFECVCLPPPLSFALANDRVGVDVRK